MKEAIKNCFVLRSGGVTKISHNIVTLEYNYRVMRKESPVAYIAVGTGRGNLTIAVKALKQFGYAAPTETISYEANSQNGLPYIIKRAVIPADVMVGAEITEVGFAYNESGALTTVSNLNSPIRKGQEELEIIAVVYIRDGLYLRPGENYLVKCFLGEELLDLTNMRAAYTKFTGWAEASAIPNEERYHTVKTGSSLNNYQSLLPKLTTFEKPDCVVFVGGEPLMVLPNVLSKIVVSDYSLDTDSTGGVEASVSFDEKMPIRVLENGQAAALSMPCVFGEGLDEEEFCSMQLRTADNIMLSADRRFVIVYSGKCMTVYINHKYMLKPLEELVFANNISHIAICGAYILVVCNYSDTVGADLTARRLYKYVFFESFGTITAGADLEADVDMFCAALGAANEINLYYTVQGVLYEKSLGEGTTGNAVQLGTAVCKDADFLFGSYKRGTVFGLKYGSGGSNNIKHYLKDGLEVAPLSSVATNVLTQNAPDCAWYSGEVIVTLNTQTGELAMYGYIGGWVRTYQLKSQEFGAKQIYLNEGMVNIVTGTGEVIVMEIDKLNGQLVRRTGFGVASPNEVTQVFALCDMVCVCYGRRVDCYRPTIVKDNIIWSEALGYSKKTMFLTNLYELSSHKSIVVTIS